jgi:hypothetical protein
MILAAFAPLYQNTTPGFLTSLTVAGGTGSATSGTLPTIPGTGAARSPQLQIANLSTGWAYVNVGPSTVAAATVAASYPVPPGAMVIISIDPNVTTVSVIMGTAAGNVIFTLGEGT